MPEVNSVLFPMEQKTFVLPYMYSLLVSTLKKNHYPLGIFIIFRCDQKVIGVVSIFFVAKRLGNLLQLAKQDH